MSVSIEVRERPILFSAPMVRALLADKKTQTRRAVKWKGLTPGLNLRFSGLEVRRSGSNWVLTSPTRTSYEYRSVPMPCPYGRRGDRLYVREAFAYTDAHEPEYEGSIEYCADNEVLAVRGNETFDVPHGCDPRPFPGPWKPSIHMPRWASRITLEVTSVRVERLWDISDDDVRAEGSDGHKLTYAKLWESINGAGTWDANPWVWVVEFRRIKP